MLLCAYAARHYAFATVIYAASLLPRLLHFAAAYRANILPDAMLLRYCRCY